MCTVFYTESTTVLSDKLLALDMGQIITAFTLLNGLSGNVISRVCAHLVAILLIGMKEALDKGIVHPGITGHFDLLSLNRHCGKTLCHSLQTFCT